MTEETKNAPAAAPAAPAAPTPQATPIGTAPNPGGNTNVASRDLTANPPATARAAEEANAGRSTAIRPRAGVITNPKPPVDPDAPVQEERVEERAVPQSTIDEMEAGRQALKRNQPVAAKLEKAREDQAAGRTTTAETNPVDATHTLQQQNKV